MDSVDKQIQTLSVIVSRMNLAARMGKAYDNSRDLFQALGYPPNIEYDDLLARYCRQDIVRAVVDKPVKATWRNGFKLVETADANETPFEKEWADLSLKLRIPSIFTRLDRLCAFGDYGVLLLGFDDVTALEEFAQPVQSGKRQLNYLRPFGQANAVIQQWETDPNNERYGLPVTYQITTVAPGTSSTSTALVHYSRVLHVAEDLLESDVQGLSRLEPIYNRFMDLEKLVGGSAEMFWRGARPGYQGKIDPEYTMTSETKDDLKSQIDEFEHNLRRILVNEGIDLTSLQQQIADPASHVDVQLQMISAVTGIPKRILVGSERGELSSSQDQDAWSDLITNRREDFVEPCIIRPFVERVCLYGVISSPADMTYDIEWPSMYESSDQEKAQVGATRATALKDYCSNPTAESVIPPKAFFQFFLGFEEEDIELIEQMVEAGMQEEEAAVKQLGITPEQLDQIQNPDKYINGKKIIPGTEPAQQQPYTRKALADTVKTQELESNSFPGHKGRPGHVGGSVAGVGEEGAKGAKAPGAKSLLSDAAARKEAITRGVYVPPGWHDIVLNPPGSERIVYGKDEKGRVVSSYTDEFRNRNKDTKFNRVRAFAEVHDSMMKRVNEDFDKHDEAKVLYLINKTGFRVGGRGDTKADVLAYGASTLKPEHIRINGDAVEFIFTGKKGVSQDHIITDAKLARMLKGRMGQEQIFNTNDDKVRQYLKTIDPTGKNFLVKDLRTYVATSEAAIMIKSMKRPTNEKELKEYKKAVAQRVSAKLGNRWQESLKSYIDPAVFHVWEVS